MIACHLVSACVDQSANPSPKSSDQRRPDVWSVSREAKDWCPRRNQSHRGDPQNNAAPSARDA